MTTENGFTILQKAKEEKNNTKAYKRLNLLFDEGSFTEVDSFTKSGDDYAQVAAGFGVIEGFPAYAFAQNIDIKGGAMSKAQARKICKIYELAEMTGVPVIGIYDSIGGCLDEEDELLAAFGNIILKANNLSGVVPQISIIAGPCLGTSALIASSADIVIMSEEAQFEIETDGQNGSSQSVKAMGMAHIISKDDSDAITIARNIITMLPSNNLEGCPLIDFIDNSDASSKLISIANEIYKDSEQATAKDLVGAVSDMNSFVEFQQGFGEEFTLGLSKLCGNTIGIIASNGGLVDSNSCSKAARFIRFCDAFAIPIVSFVNSAGFNSLREASKLSNAYSEATTVKVTIIVGGAFGPLYIAVAGSGANADITMAWPTACISALNPKTVAIFLNSDKLKGSSNPIEDRKKLIKEYKDTEASPFKAAANGFVQDIIDPSETRYKVCAALDMLRSKRVSRLPKKHANIQV